MPSLYDKPHCQSQASAVMRDFPRRPEDALADEVRALRHDIAQLRAELKPVQSLILTGQQVAAEFRRLSGGRTC
jgi:cob(I)alamin adenosyltransferase